MDNLDKTIRQRLSQINPAPILEQVQQELEASSQKFFEKCLEAMNLSQKNAVLTLQLYQERLEARDLRNALAQQTERATYWQNEYEALKGGGIK